MWDNTEISTTPSVSFETSQSSIYWSTIKIFTPAWYHFFQFFALHNQMLSPAGLKVCPNTRQATDEVWFRFPANCRPKQSIQSLKFEWRQDKAGGLMIRLLPHPATISIFDGSSSSRWGSARWGTTRITSNGPAAAPALLTCNTSLHVIFQTKFPPPKSVQFCFKTWYWGMVSHLRMRMGFYKTWLIVQ